MPQIVGRDLDYAFGGTAMRGYFAIDTDGAAARPGILIVPDAFGLDAFCMAVADRLAGHGYAALAIDLWGERRQFTSSDALTQALGALLADRATWMGRVGAARGALAGQAGVDGARIAGIGYCLGGSTLLEFVRGGGDIAGAVSFHGGLDLVGGDWSGATTGAKLLICTGVEDPLVPWTSLTTFQDNLRAGGINWELDVYSGAKHSFTRPDATARSTADRAAYDPQSDRRSWRAMAGFIEELFERRP